MTGIKSPASDKSILGFQTVLFLSVPRKSAMRVRRSVIYTVQSALLDPMESAEWWSSSVASWSTAASCCGDDPQGKSGRIGGEGNGWVKWAEEAGGPVNAWLQVGSWEERPEKRDGTLETWKQRGKERRSPARAPQRMNQARTQPAPSPPPPFRVSSFLIARDFWINYHLPVLFKHDPGNAADPSGAPCRLDQQPAPGPRAHPMIQTRVRCCTMP